MLPRRSPLGNESAGDNAGTTERETRMAVYDIEEQEKLDDLKAWWNQWGNLVSGVVIAVALGVFAVQGWRWWQGNQAEQASVLFTAVSAAAKANDVEKAKEAAGQLASRFGGTGYAPRAALLVSKLMFDAGDTAGATAQLQFVLDRASEDELKQIARIRLAEIQFETKQYDNALRTLDAKRDEPFAGVYEDLRGDILAAAGRISEARTAYQTALTKLDSKGPYHGFVQAKLDAIGGPLTADAGKSEPMTVPANAPGVNAPGARPVPAPAAPASAGTSAPAK
jgi:predicted negative regulator of RcsB-dependent stress response